MNSGKRTQILSVITVVLIAVVALSKWGVLPAMGGSSDPDAPPSARERYLDQSRLRAQESELVTQAPLWRRARAQATDARESLDDAVITAPTPALAGAQLRDEVLSALRDLSLRAPNATVASSNALDPESPEVRLLSVDVSFDATQHADAYVAIDRLENLPRIRTNIESVQMTGPSRSQMGRVATVRLRLVALAIVEQGGAAR